MPHPTVRLFATKETAESAVKELRRHRFSSSDILVVAPPAEGAEDHTVASIVSGGISKAHAEKYAAGVRKGGTLVAVTPPFGTAGIAEEVLDHYDPIDSGVYARDYHTADYDDDATPFSRMLGWRVLSNNPEPFSSWLGWKTLSDTKTKEYPATIKVKMLGGSAAPFSRMFGLPLLSGKAAPFSGMFGLATLSAKAAPFSSLFGAKTLTTKQTVLGDPKISSQAAPLSDALHLPVLTKDQS